MPSKTLADTVANRYLVAFAAVWKHEDFAAPALAETSVMFCVASRSAAAPPDDYSSLAKQAALDVVMLEFEPGAEGRGPWNVVVCMRTSSPGVLTFPECRLWLSPRKRVMGLITSDQRRSLLFDGAAIRVVDFAPEGDLGLGQRAAKRRLGEAYRRVPSMRSVKQRERGGPSRV